MKLASGRRLTLVGDLISVSFTNGAVKLLRVIHWRRLIESVITWSLSVLCWTQSPSDNDTKLSTIILSWRMNPLTFTTRNTLLCLGLSSLRLTFRDGRYFKSLRYLSSDNSEYFLISLWVTKLSESWASLAESILMEMEMVEGPIVRLEGTRSR